MTDAQLSQLRTRLDDAREALAQAARNTSIFATEWDRAGFYVTRDQMSELRRALGEEWRAAQDFKRAKHCAGLNEPPPEEFP